MYNPTCLSPRGARQLGLDPTVGQRLIDEAFISGQGAELSGTDENTQLLLLFPPLFPSPPSLRGTDGSKGLFLSLTAA